MKKFLILGLIVVAIPLLGIPLVWKTTSLILTGLFIVFTSVTYNQEKKQDSRKKDDDEDLGGEKVFVENEENFEKE